MAARLRMRSLSVSHELMRNSNDIIETNVWRAAEVLSGVQTRLIAKHTDEGAKSAIEK